VVVLGMLDQAEDDEVERELGAQIAHTGADQSVIVAGALAVFLIGSTLTIAATRRRRATR
jgi:hypothetical protein